MANAEKRRPFRGDAASLSVPLPSLPIISILYIKRKYASLWNFSVKIVVQVVETIIPACYVM